MQANFYPSLERVPVAAQAANIGAKTPHIGVYRAVNTLHLALSSVAALHLKWTAAHRKKVNH
jgi:hypothetical protein